MEEITIGTAPGIDEHPGLALVGSAGILPGFKERDELATPESTTSWPLSRDLVADGAELHDHCRSRLPGLAALSGRLGSLRSLRRTAGRPPRRL